MCALRGDSRVSFELLSSEISFPDHEESGSQVQRSIVESGGEMCLA